LVVGWLAWGTVTLLFAAIVWFSSYGFNMFCYSEAPNDDSPYGAPSGLSLWPFGPGCAVGETGWEWTVVSLALTLLGVALGTATVKRRRRMNG